MLKLTHSFYRYTRLTYEDVIHNTFFVKNYTQFSRCKISGTWNNKQLLLDSELQLSVWSQQLVNVKKRFNLQKSHVNSHAIKRHSAMSGAYNYYDFSSMGCPSYQRINTREYFNRPEQSAPEFRVWEDVGNQQTDGNFQFRVLSYNVLAQYLLECHPYLYKDCTSCNLKWTVRAARIFDEILTISPDVFCLQEVQVTHLKSFYEKFEDMGYLGVYKQKTGRRQDGCAIYYKKAVFDIIDHFSVEYYQPELPILNRDNIGLMVKLVPKCSPKTPIVVATTHLLYNPHRSDIRLAQIQILLAELDRFAYVGNVRGEPYLPIILTGDLNSSPDSAVVQLLDRGNISAASLRGNCDWERIGVTDSCQHLSLVLNRRRGNTTAFNMVKIHNSEYVHGGERRPQLIRYSDMFNSAEINHYLRLVSVYETVKCDTRFEATTYQGMWVTVDYMYFSLCSSLQLLERLRLPTDTECRALLGRLPNEKYGSDHLALAATFELKTSPAYLKGQSAYCTCFFAGIK